MKKTIKPPFLSTSFSEEGKNAKRRFANILTTKRRKAGAAIVAAALAGTLSIGALVACESRSELQEYLDGPGSIMSINLYDYYTQELYDLRQTSLDEESVNRIAETLDIAYTFGNYTLSVEDNDLKFVFETPFIKMGQYDCFKKAKIYSDVIGALIDAPVDVEWDSPESMNISFSLNAAEDWDSEEAFKEYLTEIGFAKTKEPSMREALEGADVEEFKKNAVIINHDKVENQEVLRSFLSDIGEHRESTLDILRYTKEGDPLLIRVQGNGRNFGCVRDGSRDRFGSGDSFYDYGLYYDLKIFKQDKVAYFYLVNQPELTFEDIMQYMLSSTIQDPKPFLYLFAIEEGEEYEEAIY